MKSNSIKTKVERKLNSPENNLRLQLRSKRDHYMYNLFFKGVSIGIFQISYTSKEFGKGLIGTMARQLGISSQQLIGIEKCTFWSKDFIENSRLVMKP